MVLYVACWICVEYAYTLGLNEKSDVFSFGVVILELLTGRPPMDLAKWACNKLEQEGLEYVLDPNMDACFKLEMSKMLEIGVQCTSLLPINRPSMRRVLHMLREIRRNHQV